MDHSTAPDFGNETPRWRAPKLVALSAAGASDGGPVTNLTEGKFVGYKVDGEIIQRDGTIALGSG